MFQRCDFFLSFLGLSTYQPQHKVSCQCGIMTLLSVHLFIYLWWWQGSGTCSACSEIVRGLISWHFRRGLRPSHSLQFGLNSGNDYQSVCVCVCVCVWHWWGLSAATRLPDTAVKGACLKPGKPASSPGTLVPHRPQGHQAWHTVWRGWRGECERHPLTVVMGCHVVAGVPLRLQRSKS